MHRVAVSCRGSLGLLCQATLYSVLHSHAPPRRAPPATPRVAVNLACYAPLGLLGYAMLCLAKTCSAKPAKLSMEEHSLAPLCLLMFILSLSSIRSSLPRPLARHPATAAP